MADKVRTTATFNGKMFTHFGIHPKTCSLFGNKPEDIIEVDITIADDQTKPTARDKKNPKPDYWAWQRTGQQGYAHIYSSRLVLQICFPGALEDLEALGQGKAYRVNIQPVSQEAEEKQKG